MIVTLLNELKSYLDSLQRTMKWIIHISDIEILAGRYYKIISSYGKHTNSFCAYLKTNDELWNVCLKGKKKIMNKASNGAYYGTCHAGVCEFVVPIFHAQKAVGFISVGGYRLPAEQSHKYLSKIHTTYHLPIEALSDYYENALDSRIPDLAFVTAMITPAARMLEMIYGELIRLNKEQPPLTSSKVLMNSRIIGYIENYYNTNITVKQISEFYNCSPSYISHLFKKMNGVSIHTFINMQRIEQAKILLTTTYMPIKDIAFDIGFCDYSHFSNVFKSLTNLSPKEYRILYNAY